MSHNRLNAYRIMWLLVLYDLPVVEEEQRRRATRFRNRLLKDGFFMFQFSAYARHCVSREDADVHKARVKAALPPEGAVGLLMLTDRQFAEMEVYYGGRKEELPQPRVKQLELF